MMSIFLRLILIILGMIFLSLYCYLGDEKVELKEEEKFLAPKYKYLAEHPNSIILILGIVLVVLGIFGISL